MYCFPFRDLNFDVDRLPVGRATSALIPPQTHNVRRVATQEVQVWFDINFWPPDETRCLEHLYGFSPLGFRP
jgi:hypothetical protein